MIITHEYLVDMVSVHDDRNIQFVNLVDHIILFQRPLFNSSVHIVKQFVNVGCFD